MNSSIRRCASSRSGTTMRSMRAVRAEDDLALRQVEVERLALVAAALQDPVGRPRAACSACARPGSSRSRRSPSKAPCASLVGELRRRAHHDAMEAVAELAAVGGEDHADGERRAVLAFAQRAEVVRDALGQHRHDAVGEIDRVAALQRLAVERRARPHIPGDIGDGDGDDEAARVGRVRIGLGDRRRRHGPWRRPDRW